MSTSNQSYNLARPLGFLFIIFLLTSFLDRAIQEGMFFDGVTYASISRNLAIGKGTFWDVYFRGNWRFSEHPPLMFGIQALFFKALGDHYLTERIYCLVSWLLTALLMQKVWNSVSADTNYRQSFVFTLLSWGIMPTVMWAYPNNLLDSTMAIFDLAAVAILYTTLQSGKASILSFIVAGIMIFLATLTKGPVGVFPLGMPAIYWLVYRKPSLGKIIVLTIILAATLVACYSVLLTIPAAKTCLQEYMNQQVLMALSGKREVTGGGLGRFAIIPELLSQLLPGLGAVVLVFGLSKLLKRNITLLPERKKALLFFTLLAVSASLPIMLSVKQRSFYLVPSFPYYAIAIGLLGYPFFAALTTNNNIKTSTIRIINVVLVVITLGAAAYIGTRYGKIGRDEELVSDMKTLLQYVPLGERVGVCREMDYDFAFLSYLQRYNRMEVNLDYPTATYILADKQLCQGTFRDSIANMGFKEQPYVFRKYVLYRK